MAVSPVADAGQIRRKLVKIAAFLPAFESPGFEFGRWSERTPGPGMFELPYVTLSELAADFMQVVFDSDLVAPFDWGAWAGTRAARRLRDKPGALESADAEQVARLLIVMVRQNRFVEGALLADFQSGWLVSVLRRAAMLGDHTGV